MNLYCHLDSPIGTLLLTSDGVSLTGLYMEMRGNQPTAAPAAGADWIEAPGREPLATTVRQLREYFDKKRRKFDLPLHIQGTPFQRRVWQGADRHSVWRDSQLRPTCPAHGAARCIACGGSCQRQESDCHRRALSSGYRRQRCTHRLRRRSRAQTMVAVT